MHDFTSSTWTIADTDRARERFARMDDEKLLKTLEAAATCARLRPIGAKDHAKATSFNGNWFD